MVRNGYFCCHNDLFSVQALVTGGGTVVERYEYDPYGKVTVLDAGGTPKANPDFSEFGSPWTFTGRRLDQETSLLYFRNRYYHPGLGRFLSRDARQLPLALSEEGNEYQDGSNLYAAYFVPCRTDPRGLACANWCCPGGIWRLRGGQSWSAGLAFGVLQMATGLVCKSDPRTWAEVSGKFFTAGFQFGVSFRIGFWGQLVYAPCLVDAWGTATGTYGGAGVLIVGAGIGSIDVWRGGTYAFTNAGGQFGGQIVGEQVGGAIIQQVRPKFGGQPTAVGLFGRITCDAAGGTLLCP
jgi:RHS repeat-associated protein